GALFYTNGNSAFNSLGYFQNLVGAKKDYANRNQFGGRLGGPIKKNKAFFFVLLDDQRYVERINVVSTVLTGPARDRKSTRLNSSHDQISYAVFCLKKKNMTSVVDNNRKETMEFLQRK